MLQTITQALQEGSAEIIALPLAFALGLVSAVASACCTLPAMGMLVAYSGTREATDRRGTFAAAAWFLVGATLALVILGFVAGLIGQAAQAFLGRYWRVFAGLVAVVLGLATLQLLPVKLPKRSSEGRSSAKRGSLGAALGGLFLGGGVLGWKMAIGRILGTFFIALMVGEVLSRWQRRERLLQRFVKLSITPTLPPDLQTFAMRVVTALSGSPGRLTTEELASGDEEKLYLLGEPGVSLPSIAMLSGVFRARVLVVYVVLSFLGCVIVGYVFNLLI